MGIQLIYLSIYSIPPLTVFHCLLCIFNFAEPQKSKRREKKTIFNLRSSTVDSKKQTNKFSQKTKHEEHTVFYIHIVFYIFFMLRTKLPHCNMVILFVMQKI